MVENGPGTFNLIPDTVPYDDKKWLHLTLGYRNSTYFGNPLEGQHLRIESLGHSKDVTDFKVYEKRGKQEKHIGYTQMLDGQIYRLADTQILFSSRRNHPDRISTNLYVSMPPRVVVLRDEIYEKAKNTGKVEEVSDEVDMAVRFQEFAEVFGKMSGEFSRLQNNF